MDEREINECFHFLKLRRGASFASVKQAYRKNLNKCHPDRFQDKPDLLPVAERKTKRLIEVYSALERWYMENGGSDPDSGPASNDASARPFEGAFSGENEDGDLPKGYPSWLKPAVGVALAACLCLAVWRYALQPGGGIAPAQVPEVEENYAATAPSEGPPPAAPATPASPLPNAPTLAMARVLADVGARTADFNAVAAEAESAKRTWIRNFARSQDAERLAARDELARAQEQYSRDVLQKIPEIEAAQREESGLIARADSAAAAARDAYVKSEAQAQEVLKQAYESWVLEEGRVAVGLIRKIPERDDSKFEVFSDTDDPRKIFEFWTPGEAGAPEINIAAKTGITVLQPNDRFFPHFRSNIFLHEAESKALISMMESVVARHETVSKEIADRRLAEQASLARWNTDHPRGPLDLSASSAAVLGAGRAAVDRLAKARLREGRADSPFDAAQADAAFQQSDEGRAYAARVSAAQANLEQAKRALAEVDPVRSPH